MTPQLINRITEFIQLKIVDFIAVLFFGKGELDMNFYCA